MSLTLRKLKELHDDWYTHNQVTRERAADDMLFYHVTHWDSMTLNDSQLTYKGEFDMLKKAGRRIKAQLTANPVQIDFQPVDEEREDGADFLDGIYRSDDRRNTTCEAYANAEAEAIICGVGAWEMVAEYETNRAGDKNQGIRRSALYEANNTVFWDSNAKRLDKSDARGVSILVAYSEQGYIDLVKELTGEEMDSTNDGSFKFPETTYAFPWVGGQDKKIYVTRFYYREKVKDKVLTLNDPFGQQLQVRESDLIGMMDELIDEGYTLDEDDTKVIERWEITRYIASGERILKVSKVAGENLPVIPIYGERAFVEDEETYEGITRTAKDPSRLRDFALSYMADIFSRSPRPKPIFTPQQIQNHKHMYEESGANNNLPYYLIDSVDVNGNPIPVPDRQTMPEQQVPQSLMMTLGEMNKAINDSIPDGTPKDFADIDLSGKALRELNAMINEQAMVYQEHRKFARRRDAEVYASMASVVYDAPRQVNITLPDGTRKPTSVMESVLDEETGETRILNDITNMQFDVFADIGASYTTLKEETFEQLGDMSEKMAATDPDMAKSLRLKQLTLVDGVDMKDIRKSARNQLILSGFQEPETDEEKALLEQSQQNQRPDSSMVMAQAEMEKANADMAEVQRAVKNDGMDNVINQQKLEVSRFDAGTKRLQAQVDAETAQAELEYKRIDTMTKRIDSVNKLRASVNGR